MGAYAGNYSRLWRDILRRQFMSNVQMGMPMIDADINDYRFAHYELLRRVAMALIGNKAEGESFRIVGTGAVNDFTVRGGDGSAESAGRIWVKGHLCLLDSDRNYKSSLVIEPNLTAIGTGLTATVLTDSAGNFSFGGSDDNLAGRTLVPNVADGTGFTITANTRTMTTVSGDMTAVASVGDRYRIELSTPVGGNRDDLVYIDVFLDEIDAAEDPVEVLHAIGGQDVEAQRRIQLRQVIMVREGSMDLPAEYVDEDGNRHWRLSLAILHRLDGKAVIDAEDVEDLRATI